MKSPAIAVLAAVWLLTTAGSCATTSEFPTPSRTVEVPVAIECAAAIPAEPAWPDTAAALQAAPDLFERVKLLLAGRALRTAYALQLQAALAGCVGQAEGR
jgi:hypothetical protein